jgi:hypothetical protein
MNSDLNVSGNSIFNSLITMNSELNVSGNTIFNGLITMNSELNVSGNTIINGFVTIKSNLNVNTIQYINLLHLSDERKKYDITNTILGLDFINKIKPVDYKMKYDDSYHHGFIAQDIKKVMDQNNYNFAGYYDHNKLNDYDQLSLGLIEFIGPIIKAIQELSNKIDNLKYTSL